MINGVNYNKVIEKKYSLSNEIFKGLDYGNHTITIQIKDDNGYKEVTCSFEKVAPKEIVKPSISGTDENLGLIKTSFTKTYTFNADDEATNLKVEYKLDSQLINTLTNVEKNKEYTIDINTYWSDLSTGVHKLSIILYDDFNNSVTRNVAFYKNVTTVEQTVQVNRKYLNSEEQYRNVKLLLYNSNKKLEGILNASDSRNNIIWDVVKSDTINDSTKLTFKMNEGNGIIDRNSCEKLIKIVGSNQYFIIKTVTSNDEDTNIIDISCVSEEEELKGVMISIIDLDVTTPEGIFNHIKDAVTSCELPYKWKGTDADPTKKRSIEVTDACSVYEALIDMCEKFDGWLEFSTDDDGQNWIYLRTKPIDNGKYVIKGKDLKKINISYDTSSIITRMYGFGANDTVTGNEIDIMNVNPTHKSYIEDYSYYLSQGMTMEEIAKSPRCLQESIYRDTVIVDDIDLYKTTQRELQKCCVPKLEGTIEMLDLSIKNDTSLTEPLIGEQIIVVDKDINFSMSCKIVGLERKFTENPYDISIEISNLVAYNSVFKDLVHSSETVDRVISNDGESPYVPMENVKDENGFHLNFRLDDLEGTLDMTAEHFQTNFDDYKNFAHSQFLQTAEEISTKVEKGEFGTCMKQNSEAWLYCFNHASSYIEFNSTGIWCKDEAFGTGYTCLSSQGLVHMDNKDDPLGKPYHYLSWSSWFQMKCSGIDYTARYIPLPERFLSVRAEDISVNVSVKKMYDSEQGRRCACYWFGAFGCIENGQIRIDAMSTWRDWDNDGALFTEGIVDITVSLIA